MKAVKSIRVWSYKVFDRMKAVFSKYCDKNVRTNPIHRHLPLPACIAYCFLSLNYTRISLHQYTHIIIRNIFNTQNMQYRNVT